MRTSQQISDLEQVFAKELSDAAANLQRVERRFDELISNMRKEHAENIRFLQDATDQEAKTRAAEDESLLKALSDEAVERQAGDAVWKSELMLPPIITRLTDELIAAI